MRHNNAMQCSGTSPKVKRDRLYYYTYAPIAYLWFPFLGDATGPWLGASFFSSPRWRKTKNVANLRLWPCLDIASTKKK